MFGGNYLSRNGDLCFIVDENYFVVDKNCFVADES
jgi:hypothetical protein